jgi:hypothetical protein
MAENLAVATVYLSRSGVPREWVANLSRELVAEHYAATATIYERPDPDNGVDVLARLHTRADHIEQIRQRASIAVVRAYPLECAPDYADWVLAETCRSPSTHPS